MPTLTPFAQIRGSLPPLIPKPAEQKPPQTVVFAPVHAPTTHEAPDLAPLQGIPQAQMPHAVFASTKPIQYVPTDPLAEEQQHLQALQERDYQKDLHPWGTAENHPGFWGKVAHGLSVATGGPNRRAFAEQERDRQINPLVAEQSDIAQKKALAKEEESEVPLHEAQTADAQTVEITPAMASEMGSPSLTGQRVTQGVLQHLITTAGATQSKERIAASGNETKLDIAQLQADSRAAAAAGKPQPHIITMQDGVAHVMERDPKTGAYTVDRGIAPPNYAALVPEMLSTKTIEKLGNDGVMHRFGWNNRTQNYDFDQGPAPTGTAAHQIFQGAAVENFGPQVIADLQANREVAGKLSSYWKQWLVGTPIGDPKASEIMSELLSYAGTQPALHQFRSTNAMEAFEKIIGGLAKNPDATIASIQGSLKLAHTFTDLPKNHGRSVVNNNENQSLGKPPAGADVKVKGADGKLYWGNSKTKKVLGPVE